LTAEEKFKFASKDALDRGTVGLAALFGGAFTSLVATWAS